MPNWPSTCVIVCSLKMKIPVIHSPVVKICLSKVFNQAPIVHEVNELIIEMLMSLA